jgi:opacity protein-like surface antigen
MFSNNFTGSVLACALSLIGNNVYANTSLTVGYTDLSAETEVFDISLSALSLSALMVGIGYELDTNSKRFTLEPGFRVGIGVNDDTAAVFGFDVVPADVAIEHYVVLSLRGNYVLSDSVYLFAQPAYANIKIEVSNFGESDSDNKWDFGYGIGAGFSPVDNFSLEVSYEKFDKTDVLTGAVRYRF